jgi:HK97 family phage major capsid protein
MSEKLLRQGGPAGEAIVQNGLASDLAVGVDVAVIDGSGASGQPLGIRNTVGIGTASGTSLGYSGLVGAQKTVADANAILDPTGLGYVTTPTVAELLKGRQRFTGTDSPLWRGAIHEGEVEGVRALATKQMPAAALLYGDWSAVVVPEWGVLTLEVNPFADFKAAIVGVRALWSLDVIVQHPSAFVSITSIT